MFPVYTLSPLIREEPSLSLKFYTDNTTIQTETIAAAQRLQALGIRIGTALRPLCIFNREPINGNPDDNTDPFWSHYNPLFHSIQITRRPGSLDVARMRDTLHHEMGHATLGHSLIQITTSGGPHSITLPSDPAVAMSEGWAHFIALAIQFNPTAVNPIFKGMRWDTRDTSVACRADIEYNVGCMLWDIFDVPGDTVRVRRRTVARDTVVLPLREMFRVYSPTLEAIPNGPVISSIADYLSRLENNNPSLRARIERARTLNCC